MSTAAILLIGTGHVADDLWMSRRLPYNLAQYLFLGKEISMATTVHIIEFSDYL
jgi:hypothetical protein